MPNTYDNDVTPIPPPVEEVEPETKSTAKTTTKK